MAIIGIDLGTTNSLIASFTDGVAKIIPNILGNNLTPSVVSVDKETGDIIVGELAKERLLTHPELTASNFKRYIGTEKIYNLGSYNFKAEELSSFVLKSLKEDAEIYLKETITEAVISVPAYFNDSQRKATKIAAELAGLKVERLISEPTAAAIAYGIEEALNETQFLIFDLGGGTFDVSILEIFDSIIEVKSVAGNNYLGGEDFNKAIIDYFLKENSINPLSLNPKEKSLINKTIEDMKKSLSSENLVKKEIKLDSGTYSFSLTNKEFEKITENLVLKLKEPIEKALRDSNISPSDISTVVLIGGSTKMPLIKNIVGKMFNKFPYCNINPDETVALGAAIQSALKKGDKSLEEVILTDVCPYTLGVEVLNEDDIENHLFLPIIERNSPIPISRIKENLSTVVDNQTKIHISIYQGESMYTKNNIQIGDVFINVPPNKAGFERIDIRFTYDINGLLEVEITSKSTNEKVVNVIENIPGVMSKEEIEKSLEKLKAIKIHPRDDIENKLIKAKLERYYEESLAEKRKYILYLLQNFNKVLESQDEKKVLEIRTEIKEILKQL